MTTTHSIIRRFLALVALSLFLVIPGGDAHGDEGFVKFDESRAVNLMLDQINLFRTEKGLNPLILDTELSRVSREHSTDMATRDYFGHFDPDGIGANDRVRRSGFVCFVSENVGVYRADGLTLAKSVTDLMDAFIDSPPHRKNLLDSRATHIGLGYYQDEDSTSTIFGRDHKPTNGYGTIFVTQNFYKHEIESITPGEMCAGTAPGREFEISIWTLAGFDVLSLQFETESFFSEEYFVNAEKNGDGSYGCLVRFPEEGIWRCRIIGVTDEATGTGRSIGQLEFLVE